MKYPYFVSLLIIILISQSLILVANNNIKPTINERFMVKMPKTPIFIYNNWSSYDELSDNVALTESLAMSELNELIRWKKNGVKIDYYVMDAFWFDIDGGYRQWDKKHWRNGPEKWLAACKTNNIKPGMWFSTNLVSMGGKQALNIIPEWKNSVTDDPNVLSLFEGNYTKHLSKTLQIWYDKGVRLFKFDFAYFNAASAGAKKKFTQDEIVEKNKVAFMNMLQQFRKKNPDVLITAYNGFGGDMENTFTPFNKQIDPRWLETFNTLYCGDPRFSDVPMMNIWRSGDNYSDHQVNAFNAYGVPVPRIDNCAFMIGKTGTCYNRADHCWKGMLILELARGGWFNVFHGNLELLNDNDVKWFAKAQKLFYQLQLTGNTQPFGAIPGTSLPYGFKSITSSGCVCTVVNPSQSIVTVELPASIVPSRIIYTDGGFKPVLNGNKITLGAEQMAVVGFGEYSSTDFTLGIDDTIQIPTAIQGINTNFTVVEKNCIKATIKVKAGKDIRILFQQFDANNLPYRSWPWTSGKQGGDKMNDIMKFEISQDGKAIPFEIRYDKLIWSGLSWAACEIKNANIDSTKLLFIRCVSNEKIKLTLKAEVFELTY